MAEQGWTPLEVMQAQLQNLMSQGFMTAAELMTCCLPDDPTPPMPVEGYVVAFAPFYE
jgi:hypothetical protein